MRNDIHIQAVHPLPSRFAGENWKTWPFASSPMEQLSSTPGLFIGVINFVGNYFSRGGGHERVKRQSKESEERREDSTRKEYDDL